MAEVTIHHVAVAMANLCGKAGMTGIRYDAKDPTSPVAGRADPAALAKVRRLPYVRFLSVQEEDHD